MKEFTKKKDVEVQNNTDAKKSYAHPDVIDLLSVDETQGGKIFNPIEGLQGANVGS